MPVMFKILFGMLFLAGPAILSASEFKVGDVFIIDGRQAKVTHCDNLPFVQDDYTRRFKFDAASNPKLKELREQYRLDHVIAAGRDEFAQQVLLMDWVHNRFQKFGKPGIAANGALEILRGIEQGETFFCAQYAQLMASAAASLGWVDRVLALRRHQGANAKGGSTEHSTTEIWSNQHRKWVMLDPTSNFHVLKSGVPLNAWEIRQDWFYNDGRDLIFVVGKDQRKYRKADLPIHLKRFTDFGDLTLEPDELDKYGFIGYIPNTDLMDSGYDYAQMFITKDQLCDGTEWHKRTQPAHPALQPYFPIGQAAIQIASKDDGLAVTLQTLTPNLKHFETRENQSDWRIADPAFLWRLRPGPNQLQARTLNQFGIPGPISTVRIEMAE